MTVKSEKAVRLFNIGYHCAQSVLSTFREQYGMFQESALKIASGLGGGIRCGEVYGAASGAVLVIGLKYGQYRTGDAITKGKYNKDSALFMNGFYDKNSGDIMIRNILFDLDDTLLDFHLAEKIALTKTLVHLGIEPKEATLSRYSAINLSQWKLLEQEKITRNEVKTRRYQLLFDELQIDCSAEYAAEYYENLLGVGHYFVDGAEELLKQLAKDYRLYIVSNGTAKVQESRIKSSGIAIYLDDIFISQQIGFDKPNVKFFNYCFSSIPNFKKHETLIIGDSLSSDIMGGKNSGIKTVWFNPDGLINHSDIVPDHEIHYLLDLIPLLQTAE